MPGISLIFDKKKNISSYRSRIDSSLSELLHFDDYYRNDLHSDKSVFIVSTQYPEYPVHFSNIDNYKIIIEGKIYNRKIEIVIEEIKKLVSVSNDSDDLLKPLNSFLTELDGDYIFLVINPEGDILVLNDPLARLPLYLFADENKIVISREVRFINKILLNNSFNKIGMAECLLFGYPLGEKTFFNNITRILPSSFIKISGISGEYEVKSSGEFYLDQKDTELQNLSTVVDNLIDLFNEAVINRQQHDLPNLLSLSGGLDSRAILGAMLQNDLDFNPVTYKGYNPVSVNDAKVAAEIADELKLTWKLYETSTPTGNHIHQIIKTKNGLNTLSSAFLLSFYEQLKKNYGSGAHYFTGDGGDKVFPDHRPNGNIKSLDELIEYTIANKYFFELDLIAKILNISKDDILNSIYNEFESYPEESLDYKFVSFIIRERGIKWLFEAEDRNRFYFWSVTPYYSYPFFRYSMSIDDNMKKGHKLYLQFLNKLNPEIAHFENALWNVPFDDKSFSYKIFQLGKDFLYPKLPARVKRMLRMKLNKLSEIKMNENNVHDEIFHKLFKVESVNEHFSYNEFSKIKYLNKSEYYHLLTLMLMVNDFTGNENLLQEYYRREFI